MLKILIGRLIEINLPINIFNFEINYLEEMHY